MAVLRSREDWTPKQYSVSSNEEDDNLDAEDAILSSGDLRNQDGYSSDEGEEAKVEGGKQNEEFKVFREIGNENVQSSSRFHHFSATDSEDEEGIPSHDKNEQLVSHEDQDDSLDEEEQKENSSSLQQLKKDFYERSKQLKNALSGMQ